MQWTKLNMDGVVMAMQCEQAAVASWLPVALQVLLSLLISAQNSMDNVLVMPIIPLGPSMAYHILSG